MYYLITIILRIKCKIDLKEMLFDSLHFIYHIKKIKNFIIKKEVPQCVYRNINNNLIFAYIIFILILKTIRATKSNFCL